MELLHRAGALGVAEAYDNIATTYKKGTDVDMDMKKASHYEELAAIGGCVRARRNLGVKETCYGNVNKAVKHWKIALSLWIIPRPAI